MHSEASQHRAALGAKQQHAPEPPWEPQKQPLYKISVGTRRRHISHQRRRRRSAPELGEPGPQLRVPPVAVSDDAEHAADPRLLVRRQVADPAVGRDGSRGL